MPVYEFKCPVCGSIRGEFFHADYNGSLLCDHLNEDPPRFVNMKRVYSFTTTNMPTRAGRRLGKVSRK